MRRRWSIETTSRTSTTTMQGSTSTTSATLTTTDRGVAVPEPRGHTFEGVLQWKATPRPPVTRSTSSSSPSGLKSPPRSHTRSRDRYWSRGGVQVLVQAVVAVLLLMVLLILGRFFVLGWGLNTLGGSVLAITIVVTALLVVAVLILIKWSRSGEYRNELEEQRRRVDDLGMRLSALENRVSAVENRRPRWFRNQP